MVKQILEQWSINWNLSHEKSSAGVLSVQEDINDILEGN